MKVLKKKSLHKKLKDIQFLNYLKFNIQLSSPFLYQGKKRGGAKFVFLILRNNKVQF